MIPTSPLSIAVHLNFWINCRFTLTYSDLLFLNRLFLWIWFANYQQRRWSICVMKRRIFPTVKENSFWGQLFLPKWRKKRVSQRYPFLFFPLVYFLISNYYYQKSIIATLLITICAVVGKLKFTAKMIDIFDVLFFIYEWIMIQKCHISTQQKWP